MRPQQSTHVEGTGVEETGMESTRMKISRPGNAQSQGWCTPSHQPVLHLTDTAFGSKAACLNPELLALLILSRRFRQG